MPPVAPLPAAGAGSPAGRREVAPFRPGDLVGQRYRIGSLLGEDDQGWIYQVSAVSAVASSGGESPAASSQLALRLLRPRFGADGVALSADAQKLWRSQLERLRDLRHPGIVPVSELCLGDEHGRVYVVRPAVEFEGQPLATLLQSRAGGLPEAEAVRLYAAISEVVEAAHQHGVVHLGLSPQRIFLCPTGESLTVRIADFALLPSALAAQYGEPGYLAPEQVEDQPCDRRTDQFTLAVVLYEMLSGQPAFIGAPDEARAIICRRVLSEDPLPLALSRPLELALARALSRSRAVRFPSLHDFVCALGVDGVAWSLVRPPGAARSQLSPPPIRRRPLYVPVLLGALAAVAAIGLSTRLGRRPPPNRPPMPVTAPKPVDPATPVAKPPDPVAKPPDPVAKPPDPVAKPLPPVAKQPNPVTKPPAQLTLVANKAPPPVTPAGDPGDAEIRITTDGPSLSSHDADRIKSCLRLIGVRPPYSARLVPIGRTLYLADEQATSPAIWRSGDFRDCLKNEIQGNIGAKKVIIQGIVKGRAAP